MSDVISIFNPDPRDAEPPDSSVRTVLRIVWFLSFATDLADNTLGLIGFGRRFSWLLVIVGVFSATIEAAIRFSHRRRMRLSVAPGARS